MRAAGLAAFLLVVGCEDTSRARDRHDRPRLHLEDDPAPVAVTVPARGLLTVVLGADGSASVDGAVVLDVELERTFRDAFLRDPDTSVTVVPNTNVPYSRVIQVMDLAKAAGLTSIGLDAP